MWRYMATVDVLEHLSTVELLRLTEPYQLLRLGNLTHIGDRGFFDGHSFRLGRSLLKAMCWEWDASPESLLTGSARSRLSE